MSIGDVYNKLDQEEQKTDQEQKTNETQKEEVQTQEQEQEQAQETQQDTESKEEQQEEKKEVSFIDSFNQQFETTFESEDDIKNIIKEDVGSLKTKLSKYEEDNKFLESELEKRYEDNNPEKVYGSKEGYIKHLYDKKAKEEGYSSSVVNRLMNADIDKVDALTLCMMDIENKAPELTGTPELLDVALKRIGVDVDQQKREHAKLRKETMDEEDKDIGDFNYNDIRITNAQTGELKLKAAEIRKQFKEFMNIQPEEYKGYTEFKEQRLSDIKKEREEVLGKWGDRTDEVTNDFKIKIEHTNSNGDKSSFEFTDNEFNETISEKVKEYIVANKVEPTKQNIEKIRKKIENDFWSNEKSRSKALSKIIEDATMRKEDEYDEKVQNSKPISQEKAPKTDQKDDVMEDFLKERRGSKDIRNAFGL